MPVLKVKKNGSWEWVDGVSGHTHTKSDITDFPTRLPANGGNADTVDGKHASDFASASDIVVLQGLVGNTPVSEQIEEAVADMVGSAPETLNTLNELAAALGNDENFAATVAQQIGEIESKIGNKTVSEQINSAISKTIPNVTASDNGKFLRVVDGAWVAASVPNAEEASF